MAQFESKIGIDVHLSNFEGPLDLLLFLIKEAKIDIRDIFVSKVTEQFLEYLDQLDEIDMETAGEFLDTAATLLEIKSRSLLPREEELTDEEDDPAERLIRQLEEYKLYKDYSAVLKSVECVDRFYKDPDQSVLDVKYVLADMTMEKLISAFTKMMFKIEQFRVDAERPKEIVREKFTVEQKLSVLRTELLEHKRVSFFSMFSEDVTRDEVLATFLAILELLKQQFAEVAQEGAFDDIVITLKGQAEEE